MVECINGTAGCLHGDDYHDAECCYTRFIEHEYICQECGYSELHQKERSKDENRKDSNFPPKKCPKGCNKGDKDSYSFT